MIRDHFLCLAEAGAIQARLASLPTEAVADLGMSAEDILGVRGHAEELPFFMRLAHGKRV